MEVKQLALELLEKVTEEQNYVNYTLNESVSGDANVMSALLSATLRAPGKPDLKVIVKMATMKEKLRKEASFFPYEVEVYYYSKLQKRFEEIEEKHGIPEDQRIRTPKLYGLHDEYLKETLVLEDLTAQGFQNLDREKSADMEYMSAGIDLMAKFHALSMAYFRDDPEGFRHTSETIAIDGELMEAFLVSVKPKVMNTVLSVLEGANKTKLQKYFEKYENFAQIVDNYRCYGRNILIHGDFKPGNIMYRRRNGKLELAVLDFQMVHDGDPVSELLYFIFTATDEQFRRDHYNDLLELYYERLRVALLNVHLDPETVYPEEVYRTTLERCKMLGLVMSVVVLPVILVDHNKAPGLNAEDSDLSDLMAEASALFNERFNGVINNYVEWGLL